ncbi:5'-methylthioadenosine/S-adenosylhomocysteine nucleosidase [Aureimonas sp. AU22]|uniref:5'-methylthioadenosine/S-adenosylhomocysteine nucleosidase family protein n=1 Tax=Aureimonas sp. AU22 TaxID=1638162 RepID=UPI000785C1C0|nr:5'-methylthioadenosine/S-adenosylhomocysteine nucleosidase [Aureimonas sp. AU22]
MSEPSLDQCCCFIDGFLDDLRIAGHPLEGVAIHVRNSRQQPYEGYGRLIRSVIEKYGGVVKHVPDLSVVLDMEDAYSPLDDVDTFLMLACTVSVSAETLELTHHGRTGPSSLRDRLHVLMPNDYRSGFVYRRLRKHKVHVDLFDRWDANAHEIMMAIMNRLVERKRKAEAIEKAKSMEFSPRIGIVTALPVEWTAMHTLLSDVRDEKHRPRAGVLHEYKHGRIEALGGGVHEVVVARSGAGNNQAAITAERLFSRYSLDEVFVVGIAGGLPAIADRQDDIRLGDVVLSGRKGVVQYDRIKATTDGSESAHHPRPPSEAWLGRAETFLEDESETGGFRTHLASVATGRFVRPDAASDVLRQDQHDPSSLVLDRPWRHPDRVSHEPMVFHGTIGSANSVVKDQDVREDIRKRCGAIAVEMEASGVADAATANGKPFFVVRGICDYASKSKNDEWHSYAARAAASFTYSLIRSMPLPEER